MKVLIAPDSFKGSLSAIDAAHAVTEGILRVIPNASIVQIPVADGGEGTVDAMLCACGGSRVSLTVTGPDGKPVDAGYGVLPDGTAIVEMAAASGLTLVPEELRNPLTATTHGTGEMILAAMNRGCRNIILGIGGSATNDGGVGMAQALGFSFLDSQGRELGPGGAELARLARIDPAGASPLIKDCQFVVACDVNNPLCGPNGASAIYGPQKGAAPAMIVQLDQALQHFADVVLAQMGKDIARVPGAGAAGGLGAGLIAFCGAKMRHGIEVVLDSVNFDCQVADADLVITGEGRIDAQSIFGKVPVGVAQRAKSVKKVPVAAIVGGVGKGAEKVYSCGIDGIFSIANGPMTLSDSVRNAPQLIAQTAENLIRFMMAVRSPE